MGTLACLPVPSGAQTKVYLFKVLNKIILNMVFKNKHNQIQSLTKDP